MALSRLGRLAAPSAAWVGAINDTAPYLDGLTPAEVELRHRVLDNGIVCRAQHGNKQIKPERTNRGKHTTSNHQTRQISTSNPAR